MFSRVAIFVAIATSVTFVIAVAFGMFAEYGLSFGPRTLRTTFSP